MESYNLGGLTKRLLESGINLVNTNTLKQILGIKNERTFYRIVKDFITNDILINLEKNKYGVTGKNISSFEIANFLYQPSYISLETALNYWGILSQFPLEITNITAKKSLTKRFDGKVYTYSHLASKYFGMFTKRDKVLIALPEKALFDQLYLASKGLKTVNFDEYDLTHINKKRFAAICKQLKADKNIIKYVNH